MLKQDVGLRDLEFITDLSPLESDILTGGGKNIIQGGLEELGNSVLGKKCVKRSNGEKDVLLGWDGKWEIDGVVKAKGHHKHWPCVQWE